MCFGVGLGKEQQGITTALQAKKTDKRAGVIVNLDNDKKEGPPDKKQKISHTHVLLLTVTYFVTIKKKTRNLYNFI